MDALLEKILQDLKHRHLLCWNGEPVNSMYDCGCILAVEVEGDCCCICHTRIKEIASLPNISLWLYAMKNSPDNILSVLKNE